MAESLHDAFISYSRKDQGFARLLEQQLEKYRPPADLGLPGKPPDIFLDVEDFTGGEYVSALEQRLAASRKLIVLCSPHARGSRFVNDEIQRFARLRGDQATRDVIPILVGGLPNNEATGPDQVDQQAFPDALLQIAEMPLAADYRPFNPARDKLHQGAFAGDWYKILADLYEVSRGTIEQRERRRQARTRLITASVAGAVVVSLSVALVYALVQRNEAIAQRDQTEVALTRSLVNASRGQLASNTVVDDLAAVTSALTAQRNLDRLGARATPVLRAEVWGALQQAVSGAKERQRIQLDTLLYWAAIAADGQRLAAMGQNGRVRLWNAAGQPLGDFQGPAGAFDLADAAITPDLRWLVSLQSALADDGSINQNRQKIVLWDLEGRRLSQEIGPVAPLTWSVAVHPGGRMLASASEDGVRLWSLQTPQAKPVLLYGARAVHLDFSPDGRLLAWRNEAGVHIHELAAGRSLRVFDPGRQAESAAQDEGLRLKFLPDSQQLATAGRIFNLQGQALGQAKGLAISPDGALFGGSDSTGEPQVWDRNGTLLASLRGHTEGGHVRAIHGAGLVLTTGGDHSLRLWDIRPGHAAELKDWRNTFHLAMSDGAHLVATSETSYEDSGTPMPHIGRDNAVVLWDGQGKRLGELPRPPGGHGGPVMLSPDGQTLVVDNGPDGVDWWDTGRRTRRNHAPPPGEVVGLGIADATAQLVLRDGATLRLLDGNGGARTFTLPAPALSAVVDAPGAHIVVATAQGVGLWSLAGQRLGGFDLALPADARVLQGSGARQVAIQAGAGTRVFDLRGQLLADFPALQAQAISPDGRLLASSGGYYAITTVWDVASRLPVARVPGNGGFGMAFSHDSRLLGVVGNNGPTRLWRIESPAELVARGCAMIGAYLRRQTPPDSDARTLCGKP